jgi:cysteine-rich repeat protein
MRSRSLRLSFATTASLLLITAGSARAGGDPDHFLFYSTAPADGAPKFLKFGPVHLEDQFGEGEYDVVKPTALGLPADEAAIGLTLPDTHYQEFAIKAEKGTSFEKRDVRVTNACNDVVVEVTKPVSLLVPSSKELQPPAGTPPSGADHYLCYKVKAKLPKGMQIQASDQFQSRRYDLKRLTKLCVPTDKSGSPVLLAGDDKGAPFPITPATVLNPALHLVCYQAKPAAKIIPQNACSPWLPKEKGTKIEPKPAKHAPRTDVLVTGQFGTLEVDTKKEVEVCVPSQKNTACGDGNTDFVAGERCDDGDTDDGDGCSAECLIEDVSPANEDLAPCFPQPYADFWTFEVTAGENVAINADTTSAPTAGDLCFNVICPGFDDFPDDEVPCTFPPPNFDCPVTSFLAPETGTCTIRMEICSSACASQTLAPYVLTVTRDNAAATLRLRDDDACSGPCAQFTTPGTYTFKVPKNEDEVIVDVFGAQGGVGRFGGAPGLGGRTVARFTVVPGQTFQINVGGRGGDGNADGMTPGSGGFNGGAEAGAGVVGGPGGGGGGASDVRTSGTGLANRVAVAGGGGGSGGGTDCCGGVGGAGGSGGGTNGGGGSDGDTGSPGGDGGTDTMGGAAGSGFAFSGSSGLGGAGAPGDGGGGGGGGGLFGGGGGAGNGGDHGGGGGGGGSGSGPLSDSLLQSGEHSGAGEVRIILSD